jgi:hypothetical protein
MQLKIEIGQKTAPWGISVSSVEIRDVAIPVALQDAMSRQAQAEREKQARVILGSAEAAIAGQFVEAANTYAGHPEALQLRAMNIIYETTKERGATILMPSSMGRQHESLWQHAGARARGQRGAQAKWRTQGRRATPTCSRGLIRRNDRAGAASRPRYARLLPDPVAIQLSRSARLYAAAQTDGRRRVTVSHELRTSRTDFYTLVSHAEYPRRQPPFAGRCPSRIYSSSPDDGHGRRRR